MSTALQNAKNELERQKKASADAAANISMWEKQVSTLQGSHKTASQAVADVNKKISPINVTINGLKNHISQLKRQYGAKPTDSQKAEIKRQEDKLTAENNNLAGIKGSELSKAQQKLGTVNNELNHARKKLSDARNAKTAADKAVKAAEASLAEHEFEEDAGITTKFVDNLMSELTKLSMSEIKDWIKRWKEWEVNDKKSLLKEGEEVYKQMNGRLDSKYYNSENYLYRKKLYDDAVKRSQSPNFNNEIVDGIIENKCIKQAALNALVGFAGKFAIPASAGVLVNRYYSQTKMAYSIACVYGSPPSGDNFKTDLFILFLGKTNLKDALREIINSGEEYVTDKVKEKANEMINELNVVKGLKKKIYEKLEANGNLLKKALLKALPAKFKTHAVKQAAKSAGTKLIPIVSVGLSGVEAFKNMKEFGNFCKEYYSPL